MTAYWQPTATSYLGRVAKERILEAVREGVSPDAAKRIANMKKGAMAEACGKPLYGRSEKCSLWNERGTGWCARARRRSLGSIADEWY
jgi:hypothetical protein